MPRERPPPGHFKILYFAFASSFTKQDTEILPAPTNPQKLYQILEDKYPGIRVKVLNSSALTINAEYVDLDEDIQQQIREGDEVAIIPPVSAG